jgi:hypothetical protein
MTALRKVVPGRRGLRLVENIKAVPAKALKHQRQEGLTTRLFMQRSTSMGVDDWRATPGFGIKLFNLRGDVEEAFRTQEEARSWPLDAFPTKIYIGYQDTRCS